MDQSNPNGVVAVVLADVQKIQDLVDAFAERYKGNAVLYFAEKPGRQIVSVVMDKYSLELLANDPTHQAGANEAAS